MAHDKKITVEVAYANPQEQRIIALQVEAGLTIEAIIRLSGVLTLYPEINLQQQKVGIFSKPKTLTDIVQDGDRIEIYRALIIDPKEARRKRAKKITRKT